MQAWRKDEELFDMYKWKMKKRQKQLFKKSVKMKCPVGFGLLLSRGEMAGV